MKMMFTNLIRRLCLASLKGRLTDWLGTTLLRLAIWSYGLLTKGTGASISLVLQSPYLGQLQMIALEMAHDGRLLCQLLCHQT